MPSIIIPSRWRQQPQSLVQVRGRFAKGYVWSAASGVISAGRPAKLVVANAPVATVRGAKAWAFAGGSYSDNISFASVPSITYPWTYLIRLRRRSAQDDARLHTPISGSTEAVISLSVGGSGLLEILDAGYAWESLGSLSSILPVGEYRTIIVTLDASKVVRAYSHGIAYGNTSISAGTYLNLGGGAYVGGRYNGYGASCVFDVSEVGLLSGAISDAEAKALSGSLYGELFVPRRRVLYFATAGGTSQVTSDLSDSYAIRSAVAQDCADSYAIRAIANGDLADSYAIRAAINADLADDYDIQTSGTVTSDLADSYAIRSAVAQDVSDSYAIRAAVQASLADAYSVRAAVQASLADAYTIITATSADLDDAYVIRAQVAADMVDSYAVFASSGSCPSAAEIAAAVRTELAAELANMDAPVSDVPAAVWAHNLP